MNDSAIMHIWVTITGVIRLFKKTHKFVKDMFLEKYKKNWRENESKYDISLDVYMKFSIIKF